MSSGTLGGAPFVAVSASVGASFEGNAVITLTTYDRPCSGWPTPSDDRAVEVIVPWKAGGTVDLASTVSLTFGTSTLRHAAAQAARRVVTKLPPTDGVPAQKAQNKPITGFTPTGTATFVRGPSGDDAGRLKLDLTAGAFSLKGEIDVANCNKLKPM